jgi:hypothetical protein
VIGDFLMKKVFRGGVVIAVNDAASESGQISLFKNMLMKQV